MNKQETEKRVATYADMVAEQTKQAQLKLKLEKSISSHAYKLEKLRCKHDILRGLVFGNLLIGFGCALASLVKLFVAM